MALPPSLIERDIIPKFRKTLLDLNLNDEQSEDMELLRWLRARDLNTTKAEELFRTSFKWRTEELSKIMKWTAPDFMLKNYIYEFTGYDENNCPVAFVPYGRWDLKKLADKGDIKLYLNYIFHFYERNLDLMRKKIDPKTKLPVKQMVMIFDMDKYSFRQLTALGAVEAVIETLRIFEQNYPETLKYCLVFQAPRIFSIFFNIVKKVVSDRTLGKVVIMGYNEEKWKAELRNNLPLNCIPTIYGGNCTNSILNNYGQKGVKLNLIGDKKSNANVQTEEEEFSTDDEGFYETRVDAGQKLNIEFEIEQPNTTMSWSFKTDKDDIGFCITLNGQEQFSYQRAAADINIQIGSIICKTPGKYVMSFDNSYSRLKSKNLHYLVEFFGDEEEEEGENRE